MKVARQIPPDCVALDGEQPLFSGDEKPEAVFEREIGLTGEYKTRGFALARKQFQEIVDNHKKSGTDPAVDRGHETWFGSDPGTEARGWVRELSIRPSKNHPKRDALVAQIELNDLGLKAVENKHFRYLSMGLNLKGRDALTGEPVGAVLDHLALVKRPQIEGMQPLSLSADVPASEETTMKALLVALGVKEDADEKAALAALADKDKQMTALTAELNASKAQNGTLEKRFASLEADAQAAKFAALAAKLDAKIADFSIDAAERDALLKLAKVSAEIFEETIALRKPRNPSGPPLKLVDSGRLDLKSRQDKAIADFMAANPGVDEFAALEQCSAANPDLFKEVA